MDKKLVSEFVKAAAAYGKSAYQYHLSLEEVNRQKENLENLYRWLKKPETERVDEKSWRRRSWRKRLREEISETSERLKAERVHSKMLSRRVTRLEHAIEIKTRRLVE